MEALDKNVDLVDNHSRHPLNLTLELAAQGGHRLRYRMSVSKDYLKRDHDAEIIIAADDMADMCAAHLVYMFDLLGNNMHDIFDHGVVDDKLPIVAEYGADNRTFTEAAPLRGGCLKEALDPKYSNSTDEA